MSVYQTAPTKQNWRRFYRGAILVVFGIGLLSIFWLTSRYPQLLKKARHLGQTLPSMAFGSERIHIESTMPIWKRIVFSAINWIDGMKVGMGFGVLFGAFLQTALKYIPVNMGSNRYLNSVKGALIGVPAGVCANCAVPIVCGIVRGNGRVEAALGFLFSSPNFNPVVAMMTFAALPLSVALTKYALLIFVIAVLVPGVISLLEHRQRTQTFNLSENLVPSGISLYPEPDHEHFRDACITLAKEFSSHTWSLFKPVVALMIFGSIASGLLLVWVPWPTLLTQTAPFTLLGVSVISTLMPVPIALDVMFAAVLLRQGVAPSYVMLFASTLGVYSIIPTIYIFRNISKLLALTLFGFFVIAGWVCALIYVGL